MIRKVLIAGAFKLHECKPSSAGDDKINLGEEVIESNHIRIEY